MFCVMNERCDERRLLFFIVCCHNIYIIIFLLSPRIYYNIYRLLYKLLLRMSIIVYTTSVHFLYQGCHFLLHPFLLIFICLPMSFLFYTTIDFCLFV